MRTCACGNVVPENRAKHCSDPCKNRAADKARNARGRPPRTGARPRRLTRPQRAVAWGIFDDRGRLVGITLSKGRREASEAAALRGCSRVARVVVAPVKAGRRERAAKVGVS
jgi:hypothetical protein